MKLKIALVLFYLLIAWCGKAQVKEFPSDTIPAKLNDLCQMGEQELLRGDFEKALQAFKIAVDRYPAFPPAYRGLAAAQEMLRLYPESAKNLEKAIQTNPYFSRVIYFDCAVAHYRSGNYEKAIDYFTLYKKVIEQDVADFGYNGKAEQSVEKQYTEKLAESLRACEMALNSIQNLNVKTVINLGDSINTRGNEYFPFLTNQQDLLFYTRRHSFVGDENLYYSKKIDGKWSAGQSVANNFNTLRNEGMVTMTRDGVRMFFTSCGREEVMGTCDIQEAKAMQDSILWTRPLKGKANSESWESQASISCDGSTLFFSSNRPGGYGGTDIYVSIKQNDGSWGVAKNLGERINTKLDEEAPFITNDGKTLYFSSTGHLGLGDQDVFISRMNADSTWGHPTNLGPPINSAYRELGFFLSADGKNGYFSSNRREGFGYMDIYMFELSKQMESEPITLVEGFVKDSITKAPIQTILRLKNKRNIRTDENGRFFICLPANKDFKFHIFETGYKFYSRSVPIPKWDNKELFPLDILLQNYQSTTATPPAPKVKRLPKFTSIYFDFDKDLLKSESIKELDELAQRLYQLKDPAVEVVGYCDFIGTDEYNLLLSEKRANAAALYLKEKGIIVNKITIQGRGEVKDNNPRALNRRVDVRYFDD